MRLINNKLAALVISLVLIDGCSSNDTSDIDNFMADNRDKPSGVIEPIPIFKPYKAFRYNAATKRSPFEVPVNVREIAYLSLSSDVNPDPKRVKEQLESFNIEGISMVGTIERAGTLWALVDDGSGAVHQVLAGNFLGKNHGRIVSIYPDSISIIEIIGNGKDSWIERPRTLNLKDDS
ncbi:MAG: pilus assembly protein PilP [Pseudomonadales bacterium]|nr:pilus assembly protein PilP [Pseudomonadales bacterium]